MPVQILRHVKRRASQMAYNSVLYNWSLNGDVPERIALHLPDPWTGDSEKGRAFCDGVLMFEGAQIAANSQIWGAEDQYGVSEQWAAHLHGFSWLRDLRALCTQRGMGAVARTHAKMMVQGWNEVYSNWDAQSWRIDVMGARLSMWMSSYEFFSGVEFIEPGDEENFQDLFFESVMRQARHLARSLAHGGDRQCKPCGRFSAAKGLLYVGLAFEGYEDWAVQALEEIEALIDEQIAGDGSHRSGSPAQLFEVLRILLDVRMALSAADHPLPESILHAIDRMGPALRFFRHNDRHLALFHGAQEGDGEALDAVLRQAGVRRKTQSSLPSIGFERLSLGRTSVLMDCGGAGAGREKIGAPLAFELCHGRERLFVNCGSHPLDPAWQDALAQVPAHTALTLDNRSPMEAGGYFRAKGQSAQARREDLKGAALLEAEHSGYVPLNGFTHKRRLYLSDGGHDIRGEDMLSAAGVPAKPVDVAVRFHLHPKMMVSLIRDGQEALLRMPGGVGWRFHHQGGHLVLEDSVYLGQGCVPRKTKQLAIYGQITDMKAQIQWALQREG